MQESGVINKTALVLRPDERAARSAYACCTLRPDHGGVFPRRRGSRTCCCSSTTSSASRRPAREVSALLGRMPSAVGYQPTLATEMGALQERITSTKNGSITSVQAVYVPADDLTDPAPATTFCPPRRNDRSDRVRSPSMGIYPAVDPLEFDLAYPVEPDVVGEEHYAGRACGAGDSAEVQGPAGYHRHPRHG